MTTNTRADVAEGGRGQGNASGTAPGVDLVVHPMTGECYPVPGLDAVPGEWLADAWVALREQHSRLRKMQAAIDAELRRRLDVRGRSRMLLGEFDVAVEQRRESEWDADELERVVRTLIDEGVVDAREVTELIRHETTVSRREAQRLVDRLVGDAKRRVEACRSWRRSPRASLDVTRSQPLIPER